MIEQHQFAPPPELVQQLAKSARLPGRLATEAQWQQRFAQQGAQWGADQELDASINWLVQNGYGEAASRLRAARRPKPPSLKEQALHALGAPAKIGEARVIERREHDIIRRALEDLPDD